MFKFQVFWALKSVDYETVPTKAWKNSLLPDGVTILA